MMLPWLLVIWLSLKVELKTILLIILQSIPSAELNSTSLHFKFLCNILWGGAKAIQLYNPEWHTALLDAAHEHRPPKLHA